MKGWQLKYRNISLLLSRGGCLVRGCSRQGGEVRLAVAGGTAEAPQQSALRRAGAAVGRASRAQAQWLRPTLLGVAGWHVAVQAWELARDTYGFCRTGEWRAALR